MDRWIYLLWKEWIVVVGQEKVFLNSLRILKMYILQHFFGSEAATWITMLVCPEVGIYKRKQENKKSTKKVIKKKRKFFFWSLSWSSSCNKNLTITMLNCAPTWSDHYKGIISTYTFKVRTYFPRAKWYICSDIKRNFDVLKIQNL